jgi:hypothetical protein
MIFEKAVYTERDGWHLRPQPTDCGTCKTCGHACHCSNGGSCCGGECQCNCCEHDG